jgi:uncharacterized protein
MKIDVSDLLKSVGAELNINESEVLSLEDDNLSLSSPVQVNLKLTNTGGAILVEGTLKTNVRLCCCRCLKEFDQPLNLKMEEQYTRSDLLPKRTKDEEIELKEKDFVFDIGDNNMIDLGEAIRQNILVALPIKPLCKKTCKVEAPAKEKKKSIDPRLAKLKSFKTLGGR